MRLIHAGRDSPLSIEAQGSQVGRVEAGLARVGTVLPLKAHDPDIYDNCPAGNLAAILLLPWVGMALVMCATILLRPRVRQAPLQFIFLGCYCGLGVITDLGFALWARRKLLSEFRREAARRYEAREGFWKRFLGGGASHGEDSGKG